MSQIHHLVSIERYLQIPFFNKYFYLSLWHFRNVFHRQTL